jgi:hypothetical protein
MSYITVYGKLTDHRILTEDGVYWLKYTCSIKATGYFLLHKEWTGTYTIIRMLVESYGEEEEK